MRNTTVVIGEGVEVGMMLHRREQPPAEMPWQDVIAERHDVWDNLRAAGYTRLYLANDTTIVVGIGHSPVNQATLDAVCAAALGPKPQNNRHSTSVAGVSSIHGERRR